MKVTGARIYLVNVGSLHPVLVEVLTDEGVSGVGDAAVARALHVGTTNIELRFEKY